VTYKNDPDQEPIVMDLPFCGQLCELETFVEWAQPYLLLHPEEQCKTKND
jgi:hypothetical protein